MPTVQLDASLIGGGGGNAFAAAYQAALANNQKNQANQQDYELNQFKLDEARAESGRNNAFAKLLSDQNFDPRSAQGQAQMYGAGGVKGTQAYLKGQGDLAKVNADTAHQNEGSRKLALESQYKKLELMGQFVSGVTDQVTHDQMRTQLASIPEMADIAKTIPAEYDPNAVAVWKAKAVPVKDSIELELKRMTNMETRAHNIDTSTDRRLTREQQNAQYNLTRGDTLQNRADTQSAGHYDADRGIMVSKQGVATPVMSGGVPLGEKDKPLNDSQSKALGFGERMRQSNDLINTLIKEGTKANVPGMDAPIIGGLVTALSSGNQQAMKQAKTDFMTAILRRESGAAISSGEYATADKQYFPQINDDDRVLAQKEALRNLAVKGVLAEVPSKQRDSIRPQSAPKSSQDSAAMAWAKSNPNDPRAAKILQHLGQ